MDKWLAIMAIGVAMAWAISDIGKELAHTQPCFTEQKK